ncbi:MAG: hypothetical protein A2W52_02500 [Candidatus Taylorbacteria bacterium RIFCSPHIGHO2_02_49_25]|uniref:DUF2933 domain-containing protein n=1 Tax=Candidatus Taylorbacteria bacterium RIFCSPHIGHO2_02_49_25 TaxID=1802305 RepID=A0A1G2MFR9_9BACT|nr:MAG: hypothetical protein A2759_03130 [Candidatus Taylorbacteria bacterium RIFCSPHIGHO2_01_FULL_49_60]OHA21852.1 MAG: hypothetical protein A2W52_02500 [Candidatus Taylorbacteria bacterium RIFCSPHIGHO2_02_49_25]OHA35578.1 MAG: hypothetical protein A2W65_00780 [Candidatus Taylorbacteria bacterium RIFCSPLOWO2_02_50_13]OHA36867.1 MAG: hypothetical protein A3B27_01035 [Candidatus Taylorbacteria bacterium RIFCSPLOWO2_01_FULL_50_130]OHA46020.1 MAG: hypothetical protein A3G61_04200 [Candidatus Taylo
MHGHNSKHMWWMLAGCIALPLILLLVGSKTGSGSNWLLFGFVALCVGSHLAMMFKGRGGEHTDGAEQKTDAAKELSAKNEHIHKGCH